MSSETHSKNPYWERTVYIYVNDQEEFNESIQEENRSKIVLLSKGSIHYSDHNQLSTIISAPALIFINEKDFPNIKVKESIQANAIYFHPSALNDALNYEAMRTPEFINQKVCTTLQDANLLYPILGLEKYEGTHPWIRLKQPSYVKIKELIEKIANELDVQKDYWPCRSRSYFIELLILISSLMEDEEIDTNLIPMEYPPVLRSVIQYLNLNYAQRTTLEQLSKEFGTNRNTLSKLFQYYLQMTPMQYLIQLRIHFACTLLTDTELPVGEIGLRCGFFDISHFGRMFKQYMKCSPIQYRNPGKC